MDTRLPRIAALFTLTALSTLWLGASWPGEPAEATWSTTDLGVEVSDVQVGTGLAVEPGSTVEVHYVGMLEDGTVFDASRPRDTTFEFRVGSGTVIQGWENGLLGMRVGGKRRLVIPPFLGYGDQAVGNIPAGSTLYFEVDLLALEEPRRPPAQATEVEPGGWYEIEGQRVAELEAGSGKKVKLRSGERVCIDFAVFDAVGTLVEHTYSRAGCTWYRVAKGDVPPAIEPGLKGMRAGGRRMIEKGDRRYQVHLNAIGK